jgi:hypothetical protein
MQPVQTCNRIGFSVTKQERSFYYPDQFVSTARQSQYRSGSVTVTRILNLPGIGAADQSTLY